MAQKPQRKVRRHNPVAKELRDPRFRNKVIPGKREDDRKDYKSVIIPRLVENYD